MSEDKPCCPASAARSIRNIKVGNVLVGLSRLSEIFDEVSNLGLEDESIIMNELLKKVRIYNYVPSNSDEEYAKALLVEYRKEVRK